MRFLLLFFLLGNIQNNPEDEQDEMMYYEYEPVWYGPGLYNGIWFNNEADFNEWNQTHRHDFPHHDGGYEHHEGAYGREGGMHGGGGGHGGHGR